MAEAKSASSLNGFVPYPDLVVFGQLVDYGPARRATGEIMDGLFNLEVDTGMGRNRKMGYEVTDRLGGATDIAQFLDQPEARGKMVMVAVDGRTTATSGYVNFDAKGIKEITP